jgi:hypothetical protein
MNTSYRRGIAGLLLLGLGPAAGCAIPIPYAFPYIHSTKAIPLRDNGEVKAFRAESPWDWGGCVPRAGPLSRLTTISPEGSPAQVPAQSRLSVAAGIFLFNPALCHNWGVDQRVDVRLYRRGYQTITVDHHWQGGELDWQPAATPEARETAIDEVFFTTGIAWRGTEPIADQSVGNGCAGNVAEWGEAEYGRLADDLAVTTDARERLSKKAARLGCLASDGETRLCAKRGPRPAIREDGITDGPTSDPRPVPVGVRYETTESP